MFTLIENETSLHIYDTWGTPLSVQFRFVYTAVLGCRVCLLLSYIFFLLFGENGEICWFLQQLLSILTLLDHGKHSLVTESDPSFPSITVI